MPEEIFLLSLAGGIAVLFAWAFRTLPGEEWQILACLPRKKGPDGVWSGINLTYYGFFNALAYLIAVSLFLIMTGSLHIELASTVSVVLPVLAICMPAARLIARVVEKKPHTFSVGAASFTGIIIAPWIILLVNELSAVRVPVRETMAALIIAYAFGEGIGRLACISFGCCYGKPLETCNPLLKRIFRRRHFVFQGKTKKIAYAHGLAGQAVLPVQALTAVIYSGTGLLSLYLFLRGKAGAALVITLAVTQLWRFASEFLRADYRGSGRISAYQIMAVVALVYVFGLLSFIKEPGPGLPDLGTGINSLGNPGLLILLFVLWAVAFIYTGKSSVTCSDIKIRVREKNTVDCDSAGRQG